MSTRLTSSKPTAPISTPSLATSFRSPSHIPLTRPELNVSYKSPNSRQKLCSLREITSVFLELTTQTETLTPKLGSMIFQISPNPSSLAPSKWLVATQMVAKLKMVLSTWLQISKSTENIDHGTTMVQDDKNCSGHRSTDIQSSIADLSWPTLLHSTWATRPAVKRRLSLSAENPQKLCTWLSAVSTWLPPIMTARRETLTLQSGRSSSAKTVLLHLPTAKSEAPSTTSSRLTSTVPTCELLQPWTKADKTPTVCTLSASIWDLTANSAISPLVKGFSQRDMWTRDCTWSLSGKLTHSSWSVLPTTRDPRFWASLKCPVFQGICIPMMSKPSLASDAMLTRMDEKKD